MTTLTILCAIGAATAAGAFFTFSDFTIAGLKRLRPAQGAAAMQAIKAALDPQNIMNPGKVVELN